MKFPDFSFEMPLIEEGYMPVGIDEVGRGAFAGPVGVGGAIFKNVSGSDMNQLLKLGINDSKLLTVKKREELAKILKELCFFEVSFIDVATINEIGVGKATFLGMQEVYKNLKLKTKNSKLFALVDGFPVPGILDQRGIIRGDTLSISIASASIIAKVERDRLMEELSKTNPNYGFEAHKGYGTALHRANIRKFGLSREHRKDFCARTIGF